MDKEGDTCLTGECAPQCPAQLFSSCPCSSFSIMEIFAFRHLCLSREPPALPAEPPCWNLFFFFPCVWPPTSHFVACDRQEEHITPKGTRGNISSSTAQATMATRQVIYSIIHSPARACHTLLAVATEAGVRDDTEQTRSR